MKIKEFNAGDKVKLSCKDKEWTGFILESYDSEIVLLKLDSGYNIGIRESEILNAKIIEKAKEKAEKKVVLQEDKSLPNIALIITGGTISSRLDPKTGAVISTDAEEILNISPEVKKLCNIIKVEKPFMKWSENMAFEDWKILAETVEKLVNDNSIKGVIITHGTDFLHYTASALSFFLRDLNKPVALTYSQRSIDRGSTDAALNLLCAAKYAISDIAEVALIGHKDLNDNVCSAMSGTKVRKMHTSRRDAFKIVNDTPLAEISETDFKILKNFNARNSGKTKLDAVYNDKIALVQIYPGQDPDILNYYQEKGYKGLVLEITGIGQVPAQDAKFNFLPKIKKLVEAGIVVCATPQTIFGRLNPKVYSAGRDLEKTGIIFLGDCLPETAFTKLAWVLAHKQWNKKEKMLENISGEFNTKLMFNDL